MNDKKKFSIIVLTYNSSNKDIALTLASILQQKHCNFEIILSDDGSQCFDETFCHDYLKTNGFEDYKIIRNLKNQGTVKNLWGALRMCGGKYVKPIGAGDLLYDEDVLRDIYCYMEEKQLECLFGKMQAYYCEDSLTKYLDVKIPIHIKCYSEENIAQIEKNLLLYEDYISGASMFFEIDYLNRYLSDIVGMVIYCEDFVRDLIILNHEMFYFYDRLVVTYQYFSGISTSHVQEGKNRLRRDRIIFLSSLVKQHPDNKNISKGLKLLEMDNISSRLLRVLCKFICAPLYIYNTVRGKHRLRPTKEYKGFLVEELNRSL